MTFSLLLFIQISNVKTNSSFRKTNDILTTVLLRAVATGVVTAVVNGLGIVLLYASPTTNLSELP